MQLSEMHGAGKGLRCLVLLSDLEIWNIDKYQNWTIF